MSDLPAGRSGDRRATAARVAIGLAQGLVLYALLEAKVARSWPATVPALFAAISAASLLPPVVASLEWDAVRPWTLARWLVLVTVLCAAVGWHDAARGPTGLEFSSAVLVTLLVPVLFVSHCLVEAADADRSVAPRYATLFAVSWNGAVQLVLALLFVALFSLILLFGALLFGSIGVAGFGQLVGAPWFRIPATTIAAGFAIGVTAARARLVRGARTLVLTLFGFLLLLLTPIVAAFLLSLAVAPTRFFHNTPLAVGLMSAATFGLVLLINAAYGEGEAASHPTRAIRAATAVACVLLVPLVGLAALALALRVAARGWTEARVLVAAALVQGAVYAVGYLVAACRSGRWLAGIEQVNVAGAASFVLIGCALSSPLADPARLAAADQLARLRDGRVAADRFDDDYLRTGAARYGLAALRQIVARPPARDGAVARARAAAALAATGPRSAPAALRGTPPPDFAQIRGRVTMHPADAVLPDALLRDVQDRSHGLESWPFCLVAPGPRDCDMVVLHGGTADPDQLAVVEGTFDSLLARAPDGRWHAVGHFSLAGRCTAERDALLAGHAEAIPSDRPDLAIAGRRLRVVGRFDTGCGTPIAGAAGLDGGH